MPEMTTFLADLSRWAQPVTAWMLTYLLHSTLLLGAAWLLSRFLRQRRLALQETAWKVAVVGGILTATLQLGLTLGLGVEPWAGQVSLATGGEGTAAAEPTQAATNPAIPAVPATAGQQADGAVLAESPAGGAGMAVPVDATAAAADGSREEAVAPLWPLAAAALWLTVGGLGLVLLLVGYSRLHRCLAERRPVTDGVLPALFGRLLERAGLDRSPAPALGRLAVPRLTASPRLPVPIAWGIVHPEVSLPEEVVEDLSPYHQESILAHEISHLRRHDPAWLAAGRFLETALFFQPLNRVARHKLQEIAEYRCDDGAVALTGRPVELARCLTEVASWRVAAHSRMLVPGLWVPGMTTPADGGGGRGSGSALAARVRRILADGPREAEGAHRLLLPAAAALLLSVALAAPGVTGQEPAPEPPPAPEAPEAPEAWGASEAPAARETPEAPETPAAPDTPRALAAPLVPEAAWPGATPALPAVPRTAPPAPRVAPPAALPAAPRAAPLPSPDPLPAVPGTAPTELPAVPAPGSRSAPLPMLPPAGAPGPVSPGPVSRAEPAGAFRLPRHPRSAPVAAAPSPSTAPSTAPAPRADSAGLEAEIDRLVTASSDEERRAVTGRLEAELATLRSHADALSERLNEVGDTAGDRLDARLDELEARYDRLSDLVTDGEPDRAELRRALTAAFTARDRVHHELERLATRLADHHPRPSAEARREAQEHARRAMEQGRREAERARREAEEVREVRSRELERAEREAERRALEMERAVELRREALERRSEELEARREAMERRAERRAREMRHHAETEAEHLRRADRQVARENARVAEENARVAALSAQLQGQRERMEAQRTALRAELRRLTADGTGLSEEERRRATGELRSQLADLDEELAELAEESAELGEELGELGEELEELEAARREAARGESQD